MFSQSASASPYLSTHRTLEEQAARPPEKEGQKEAKEPKIDYVSGKKIRVPFTKPWLADEADVDSYLAEVKKALMKEIAAGKRIQA